MNQLYQEYLDITEVGENGDKIFPNSSIGLNKILLRFARDSMLPAAPVFDIYVVNVLTMLRNNINEDDPIAACELDIQTFLHYLQIYISVTHDPSKEVTCLLYLPNYIIPKFYARPINKATAKLLKVYERLKQTMHSDVREVLPSRPKTTIAKFKNAISPVTQIISYIKRLSYIGTNGKMLLLTHVPLDMHLLNHVKNCKLLESYTARYITANMLGKKIFKSDDVPFNTYTHLAFGDKVHLNPVLQRKLRKEALKKAKDRRWTIKTKEETYKELVACQVDSKYLKQIRF